MNGIKMSDCRFYVNEEARTVVCVIPNTRNMLYSFISQHFSWADLDMRYALGGKFEESLEMPSSFSGKAVCSADDEWNEEFGKLLAYSRAREKCYTSFFKRANTFINQVDRRLNDMVETFNNFGVVLENKREAIQNKIDVWLDHKA